MNKIEAFLRTEKHTSEQVAKSIMAKLDAHPDIKAEFESWLSTRSYSDDNPVEVEGYTAKDIVDMAPFLDGVGAYTFLITLRTNPVRAKEIIQAGFPRR